MSWYANMISGLASTYGGTDTTGKSYTASGTDWGALAGTAVKAYNSYSGGSGSSGGSSSGGGNIWESVLSGVGTAAGGYMDEKTAKEAGKQGRVTIDFAASLKDFYDQKDKVRKRAALDTYGQFSTMDRWAPNAVAAPPIEQPARPGVG